MSEEHVRKLHHAYGKTNVICYECAQPYPCSTIRALAEGDALAVPLHLPQDENGNWPGDPRFAVRVRNVYGASKEQIVEASSLKDALTKAFEIPFVEWMDIEEEKS